jgi:2-polyprenyl-3-methyl-5-hydroxy-6-metoxy-1,4-benzoquinol methylase
MLSGVIDICLAKMGANIVAIDWMESVIELANEEASGESVEFLADDIRNVSYPYNSFDCILIIETIGSMSKEDDLDLITKSFQWLKKNGRLIIDCPDPGRTEKKHSRTEEYEEGVLKIETSFNDSNSILTIDLSLLTKKNETIRLHDPISMVKGEYYGSKRYLYNKEELKNILTGVGYSVNEIPHHWGDEYYALTGTKR